MRPSVVQEGQRSSPSTDVMRRGSPPFAQSRRCRTPGPCRPRTPATGRPATTPDRARSRCGRCRASARRGRRETTSRSRRDMKRRDVGRPATRQDRARHLYSCAPPSRAAQAPASVRRASDRSRRQRPEKVCDPRERGVACRQRCACACRTASTMCLAEMP